MRTFKRWGHTIALTFLLAIILSLARFAVDTAQPPPAVQYSQSDTNQSSQRQEQNESLWRLWTWPPVTLFTFVLTIATDGLLFYTARLWEATVTSVNETRRIGEAAIQASIVAANAAVSSANTAVSALNRPWIVAHIVSDNLNDFIVERHGIARIDICFENHGGAFAEIIQFWAVLEIWNGWPISNENYERTREFAINRDRERLKKIIISPQERSEPISLTLFPRDKRNFRSGFYNKSENSVALIGQIFYSSPSGQNTMITAFSFRLSWMGDKLITDPDPTYRYRT